MNYAQANVHYGNVCYLCQNNQQTHAIPLIRSNDRTDQLARDLQAKLDGVYKQALLKGYTLPANVTMVGAIIATVGTTEVKAVALSGQNAGPFLDLIQGGLGKDVAMVSANVPLDGFRSILKVPLGKRPQNIERCRETPPPPNLAPRIPSAIPAPTYPVGSCAAQKLVKYVVDFALNATPARKITAIAMSEIFWKTTGNSAAWSTGQTVPSCNTCNYILPMLLCNYDADGTKIPYP